MNVLCIGNTERKKDIERPIYFRSWRTYYNTRKWNKRK